MANAACRALRDAGVCEHSVVALVLPNSVSFVASLLAIAQLPALVAPISTRYRESELRSICAAIRPDFLLVTRRQAVAFAFLDLADQYELAVPGNEESLVLLRVRRPSRIELELRERFGLPSSSSRPALIKLSSGSTGAPKAVLWTSDNVRAAAANVVETLRLGPSDVVLSPVSLSHSYGFDLGILPMAFAGASLVLRDGFRPKSILADMGAELVSVFLGVPAMYRVLSRTRQDLEPDLSSLRYFLSSTAPLPVELIESFRRRFGAWLSQHYGSSETGGISLHRPAEIGSRCDSVGRAMKHVALSVVDPDGRPLPAGVRGEVVIAGPSTAAGYVQEEPSSGRFRDGRYWTGDTGHLDPDGFLYLEGAREGVIDVGGWKVSLAEVARVLESHPSVTASAVIAHASEQRTKRVLAAVTLRQPVDEDGLRTYCRARLADYKVPRRIHILAGLPRNSSGQVELRAEDLPV
jgi:long-chain acyl-CoA synthetase